MTTGTNDMNAEVHSYTLEDAERIVRQRVYDATRVIEDLERLGKIRGNGHHARQKLAEIAVDELRSRWVLR